MLVYVEIYKVDMYSYVDFYIYSKVKNKIK